MPAGVADEDEKHATERLLARREPHAGSGHGIHRQHGSGWRERRAHESSETSTRWRDVGLHRESSRWPWRRSSSNAAH